MIHVPSRAKGIMHLCPPGHGSWDFHQTDGGPVENGASLSSIYYYDQQKESSVSADAQGGMSTSFHGYTSGLSVANAAQAYACYDPNGYCMYYGYQQPTSDSSSQQVGASQNPDDQQLECSELWKLSPSNYKCHNCEPFSLSAAV